jgi:DNA-binding CsgD family transcriptional regulator
MLLGRDAEQAVLAEVVSAARQGRSRALVVRGEPGVGKTSLLDAALEAASGCRVLRTSGFESELPGAFAGLYGLCQPMLDGLDHLPPPQRDALQSAFGLAAGEPPNVFLIGLAVLGLLSDFGSAGPIVCVVDDAQWLDAESTQVIAFVARRLQAESLALFISIREPAESDAFAGLPELRVAGLSDADARRLLSSVILGPLDEQITARLVRETGGNPLALLVLPRGLSPAELAGGFGLSAALPLSGQIERSFARRLERLPVATRRLLLLAALEPVGDSVLFWRAADRMSIGVEAAAPAEAEGLVHFGPRILFRHPLVRSASYRGAADPERRAAHRALAEVSDDSVDPDRRAWHFAQSLVVPDEDAARALERSAARAQARGGLAASAAFLERAAELTPERARRSARVLSAADAQLAAGAPDRALALVEVLGDPQLDAAQMAHVERLRGMISFAQQRGSEAQPLLLRAARRLEAVNPELARQTYFDALWAATFDGRFGNAERRLEAASAARASRPLDAGTSSLDLFFDGLVRRFAEGYVAAVPLMRRALELHRDDPERVDDGRWIWLAAELWDDHAWFELASRQVQLARDTGALGALPLGLHYLAGIHVQGGRFRAATDFIEEASTISAAIGIAPVPYASLVLLGWRGDDATATAIIDAILPMATARGEGMAITGLEYAAALLHNGRGRYERAFASAERSAQFEEPGVSSWVLPELIEAGVRTGRTAVAEAAVDRFSLSTRAAGTDWALGMEAESRALVSPDESAEPHFHDAIERLGRTNIAVQLARTHLLYGEWLRRKRRRVDARQHLRLASEMFVNMGADGFAERAARELAATGETARKRSVETIDQLTPQELHIAQLARDGRSNAEIGAQLFISPRTVEYHLANVFAKLSIASRLQLERALPEAVPVSGDSLARN